jgi:prepilin-type N-terminal cleavage/methylation domain-containing protein
MKLGSRGFTLVELLVVIVIIAALAALSFPMIRGNIAKSRQAACLAKMRSLGVGLEAYLQDNNRKMPDIAAGRPTKEAEIEVLDTVLTPYLKDAEAFHCPADSVQHEKTGCSYIWNSSLSGQLSTNLSFLNIEGRPQAIPLIADKEGWHPGPKNTNILYADLSASSDLRFVTTP